MIKNQTISVETQKRETFKDITKAVQDVVTQSGIKTGQVTLFVAHTTAAVTINENADPDVETDIVYALRKNYPKLKAFRHMEGNSDAHIKSSLIGNTQVILIESGRLKLGTWQGIYFCEFDGPRTRTLHMQVMGD